MPELALQEIADPASDQIRTGSARSPPGDAEPESDHGHNVHGNGRKHTHNQANNERTAFHRTAPPPLLVKLLPNEKEISHGGVGDKVAGDHFVLGLRCSAWLGQVII